MTANTAAPKTVSRRDLLLGSRSSSLKPVASISAHCLSIRGVTCRSCDDACGVRAIRFRPQLGGRSRPAIDPELCTGCGDCVPVCPVAALSIQEAASNA